MSMLEGVSQCWLLSETCVVNWDAWAAVGTVAAVFAAVFAPSIQRRLVRRKVNALFAMAYQRDVSAAKARLELLEQAFSLDPNSDSAWAVHSAIQLGGSSQAHFLQMCQRLEHLAKRDVDIAKWGAVDLDLAAHVAAAIESVKGFASGAELLATTRPDDGWKELMEAVYQARNRAAEDLKRAIDSINEAVRRFG